MLSAFERVVVKDAAGKGFGYLEPPPSPEFLTELKQRAAKQGPRCSSAQIQARLMALYSEWYGPTPATAWTPFN